MVLRLAACLMVAALLPVQVAQAALIASAYANQVIADGAIHYWGFEEASTALPAKDEISGIAGQTNNPGTFSGGIVLSQPSAWPALGGAARFDGANGSHVALGAPQHPGDSISVEAWINLDTDATSSFSPVVARWDGSYELDVNATDQPGLGTDRVDFALRNNSNDFGDPASVSAIVRGNWHHIVGTFDSVSGDGIVYLDGVPGAPFSLGGTLQNAGGDDGSWYIGTTRNPTSGFNWDGLIDEVAIYPFALSQQQINEHIRLAAVPIPEPSPWPILALIAMSVILKRAWRLRASLG